MVLAGCAVAVTLVASVASTVDELRLQSSPAEELLVDMDAVYPGDRTASQVEPDTRTSAKAKRSRALTSSAARAQCRDSAYALAGWRVKGGLNWYYNPSGAPSAVSRSALAAVRSAAQSMATGQNECRLPGPFKVAQKYGGTTKRTAAVSSASTAACGREDGYSVVSWKRLGSTALAVTCTWWTRSGGVVSSDIVINTRYRWFTTQPSRCASTYDVRSVMTHEWGHTFGLNHVSPARHGTQVMASTIPACSSTRTLGAGDHNAMRKLYGVR
ncbi:matrixin family metalloprotease [Planomonospora sp. ID67723]|nr:matrixin family metalloprotease [Planomonospora sp. ID67723]